MKSTFMMIIKYKKLFLFYHTNEKVAIRQCYLFLTESTNFCITA